VEELGSLSNYAVTKVEVAVVMLHANVEELVNKND